MAPPQGLQAYYPFDEGNGTVANDSSGSGNNGAISGATWTTGKSEGGLSFDGINDYVDLGNPLSLQPGNVSVSAWFKTTATSGVIVRKRAYGYGLDIVGSGKISFWIYNSAGILSKTQSPLAYNNNAWHHAVGVYDGSTVKLYIDGNQVASASAGTIFYGAGGIAIGRDGNSSGSYFGGLLDGISIYDQALSSQDVLDLFNNPGLFDATPPTVSATSPANNETGVELNSSVTATFSETMNASTINAATFTVNSGNGHIVGTVSYSGVVATFTPTSNLTYGVTYTATITTAVKDAAGNALAANYTWSFTAGPPDMVLPTVSATSPAANEMGVTIYGSITATFSEAMDPTTITTATFSVTDGVTPVSGTVSYAGTTATFTPANSLAYATTYTATITTGVTDLAGNAMSLDYNWSFITGQPDVTPPTVSTTSPADNEVNVAISKVIAVTFSESMDANTLTTATFSLTDGVTPVTGTVSYTGTTATFTPTGSLSYATSYTVTVSAGVSDLAGNAMGLDYSWSFSTGMAPPQGLQAYYPFDEGNGTVANDSSGNGNNGAINGATWTTGKSEGGLSFDGINDYVDLGDPLSLQPGNVSVSAWFKTTATNGVIVRKRAYGYGLDIVGSGKISFWIYNSAGILSKTQSPLAYNNNAWHHAVGVYDGSTVKLYIDGNQVASASAGTIFYGAGGIAIGRDGNSSGSYFGGLLDGISIYDQALSSQDVLDLFNNPGLFDATPPTVSATSPANNETGVELNSSVTATFSETMNASTINAATFTVNSGNGHIVGTVSYSGVVATFTPTSNLTYGVTYTATITTAVKDAAGNALAANYTWSFTAGPPGSLIPSVTKTLPVSNAVNVAVNSAINVIFSQVMDASTINTSTFTVSDGNNNIEGTISCSGMTATFTPSGSLAYATPYTVTITTGVRSSSGSAMAEDYTWSFTAVSEQEEMIPDWTNVLYGPFQLVPPTEVTNPVQQGSDVTEYPADMVADTFLFHEDNTWYMFTETLNSEHNGDLAVSVSSDGLHWTYQQIVLDEPHHLSYPQVFKFGDEYYMLPETSAVNEIKLYKSTNFPYTWTPVSVLVSGNAFVDSSIFRYNGKWWIFTGNATTNNCCLYYSDNLTGGWIEHPMSPIVTGDSNKARPAGRSFVYDNNRIIRTAQNGEFVRVFEVDTLTTTQYAEHEIPESPILNKSGSGWNAVGMHHFDPWWTGNHWLCSVDGRSGDFHSWSAGIYLSPHPSSPNGIINSPAADATIEKGDAVLFSGMGSDLGGNLPLSYRWKFGTGSGVPDSLQEDPGLTQFNVAGTFTVSFIVTDALGIYDPTPGVRTISVLGASTPIPMTNWSLWYVDSQELVGQNAPAVNAFDGNPGTYWHTKWFQGSDPLPHEIQINLGAVYNISGFRYLPRTDGEDNGRVKHWEFYVSMDGTNWGSAVATGIFVNDALEKEVFFPQKTGQYVRMRALSEVNNNPWTSMAEITVLQSQ
jgi:methionine-rich copper-binding protein CopC